MLSALMVAAPLSIAMLHLALTIPYNAGSKPLVVSVNHVVFIYRSFMPANDRVGPHCVVVQGTGRRQHGSPQRMIQGDDGLGCPRCSDTDGSASEYSTGLNRLLQPG